MSKKVAVVIKGKERQYEALRSSLGLLLEEHIVSMFVLGEEVDLTEEYKDNMGFIDEMGGIRYSNVAANVKMYGFESISLAEVPDKLRQNDVIIAF
ncbi:hypothetical protein ACFLU3_03505 [Chloroflexota bacterium]